MRIQTYGEDSRICNTAMVVIDQSWIPRSAADGAAGKLFMELYNHPGMTMSEIKNVASGMASSAVEELIYKMLKNGLVRYSYGNHNNEFWPTWRYYP